MGAYNYDLKQFLHECNRSGREGELSHRALQVSYSSVLRNLPSVFHVARRVAPCRTAES